MAEDRTNEALEKLKRGVQESKQMVQQQTMKLAQDYFGDSVEALKQQIKDNRATLEDLPGQVPGGQEEAFQMLFQELMDNFAMIEDSLDEAEKNVADLDTEQLRRQGEVDASDAARREARESGVDLTEVEGTGSGGRVIIDDVKSVAEAAEDEAAEENEAEEEPKTSDAAKRKAEELGIGLRQVTGSGSGGLITVKDVTDLAGAAEEEATGLAEQVADQGAIPEADGVVDQAGDTIGETADLIGNAVGKTANQAEQAVTGDGDGSGDLTATNAARRKAEELGIDLDQVKGTGAGGLVTIRDVVEP